MRHMSKYPNRAPWVLFLGLTVALAAAAPTHAGQPKPKDKQLDLEAEAKQVAEEEAKENADRRFGPAGRQTVFAGTFVKLSDPSQNLSPEVVGSFVTDKSDMKPGRTYLVKVEKGNKDVLQALMRLDLKKTRASGKLRVIGPDGEAKYLIVSNVIAVGPTPPVKERRKFGGL